MMQEKKNEDILYEVGSQMSIVIDMNNERVGWNRKADETRIEYIKRLVKNKAAH